MNSLSISNKVTAFCLYLHGLLLSLNILQRGAQRQGKEMSTYFTEKKAENSLLLQKYFTELIKLGTEKSKPSVPLLSALQKNTIVGTIK